MTSFYINDLCKDPVSRSSPVPRYLELGLLMNLGDTVRPRTKPEAGCQAQR